MKRYLVLILSVIAAFAAVLSLTACGKVDFTVKFSVDGETYASVSTGGSEVIKMPADPQKDGYTFDGWFWDDGVWARPFTANSLLNEPLKSDMTVYAKFSVNHSHNFNKQVATEPYLKSAATCTAKAIYYFSCECGEKGTQTFTYGELKDHTFNGTHTCAVCGYYNDTLIKTEILSKNLSVCGNDIKGKVANSQATFSFINDIEVADGATYTVCTDLACTKPVPSKTINLSVGDNVCYILVTNGNDMKLYTVTVRRRPIYTVAFNSNGGTEIKSQQVEEDSLATKPADPEKTGYGFKGYDYDLTNPIIKDTTINANWQIITYKISYVLNGGINNADNPATYTVEDKIELKPAVSNKLGYSFASWDNGCIIEKGSTGDKTFTANYTPITYKITYNCGSGKNNANNVRTYNIESDTIKLLDPYYINADFVEWQRGGVKITEIPAGSYGDIALTAVWSEYDVKLKLNSDGKTYTVIGLNTDKTDIKIKPTYHGNSVTSIGDEAFDSCTSFTSVTIPDSVTSIGYKAFYGCRTLTSVTIPASVTSIGDDAFMYCASLTNVLWNAENCAIRCAYLNHNYCTIFRNCSKLKSITVGDNVKAIPTYAFYGCTSLTNVLWNAENCTKAGYYATYSDATIFKYCSNLKFITIGDNVKTIPAYVFYNCSSLTSIIIPNNVTSIGQSAFGGCKSLTSVTIGRGITIIKENVFYGCSKLTSITIPNSVTSIGKESFKYCRSLTSVAIGDGVTSIGSDAFYDCVSLSKIYYNGDVNDWVQIDGLGCLMSYGSSDKELYINGELLTEAVIDTATANAFYGHSHVKEKSV